MINKLVGAVLSWLSKNVIGWVKNFFRKRAEKRQDEKENERATKGVTDAESKEDRDNAVRDLGNTL